MTLLVPLLSTGPLYMVASTALLETASSTVLLWTVTDTAGDTDQLKR